MKNDLLLPVFIIGLVFLSALQSLANDGLDGMTDSNLEQMLRRYEQDYESLNRFYRLPLSQHKLERIQRFHTDWEGRLEEIGFEELNQSGKIDYLLFINHLWYSKQQYEFQTKLDKDTRLLLPFAHDVLALERARWDAVEIDPEETAKALTKMIKQIETIQQQLKKGLTSPRNDEESEDEQERAFERGEEKPVRIDSVTTTKVIANRALQELNRIEGTLEGWFEHYDTYHPAFHWWVHNVYQDTQDALNDYQEFLREDILEHQEGEDPPLIGDPIGRDRLLVDLRHEMISYTPEELIEIANQEFAWCEQELLKASRELGYEDDWHAALEHVKGLHVPPGEMDQLVYRQAEEAIQFIEERDLVTIPKLCRETWRLEMSSSQIQKTLPYAFYGGQYMGVGYPTLDMDPETKRMSMRGNNIHFSRIVVPHELIPGHHLQKFMADRYNPQRQQFWTPFYVEGWALYWEMLLWDLDYPRGPEDRMGMLFWRMHRCARIMVSLKFHLHDMTPQEMIAFLVERVGHELDAATSEVRRYIAGNYSPLYQCAYMLGGLQIRALRKELVDTGEMSDTEFHDAILQQNEIPIVLIRAKLMNRELEADGYPEWKFYPVD